MDEDLEGIYKLHWRHKPIPEGWEFAGDLKPSHHSARAILIKKVEEETMATKDEYIEHLLFVIETLQSVLAETTNTMKFMAEIIEVKPDDLSSVAVKGEER